jgi:hypothetical protein
MPARLGKQHYFCPNCGVELYNSDISLPPLWLMCQKKCGKQFENKCIQSILGQNAPEKLATKKGEMVKYGALNTKSAIR